MKNSNINQLESEWNIIAREPEDEDEMVTHFNKRSEFYQVLATQYSNRTKNDFDHLHNAP